jgi:L-fucose isomerase-like protein
MVVIARAVVDLAARVAALDLDRRVADVEFLAQATLEVAHDVLGIAERAIAHHHVAAQGHLV